MVDIAVALRTPLSAEARDALELAGYEPDPHPRSGATRRAGFRIRPQCFSICAIVAAFITPKLE